MPAFMQKHRKMEFVVVTPAGQDGKPTHRQADHPGKKNSDYLYRYKFKFTKT